MEDFADRDFAAALSIRAHLRLTAKRSIGICTCNLWHLLVTGPGRPAGKVREVFDRVSKLPRRQQEHIVNWISAYVSHYEQ